MSSCGASQPCMAWMGSSENVRSNPFDPDGDSVRLASWLAAAALNRMIDMAHMNARSLCSTSGFLLEIGHIAQVSPQLELSGTCGVSGPASAGWEAPRRAIAQQDAPKSLCLVLIRIVRSQRIADAFGGGI